MPPRVQILSISCSLWENVAKSYVGVPSRVLVPPSRKNPGSATVCFHNHAAGIPKNPHIMMLLVNLY